MVIVRGFKGSLFSFERNLWTFSSPIPNKRLEGRRAGEVACAASGPFSFFRLSVPCPQPQEKIQFQQQWKQEKVCSSTKEENAKK
jgi:hypothetical protein